MNYNSLSPMDAAPTHEDGPLEVADPTAAPRRRWAFRAAASALLALIMSFTAVTPASAAGYEFFDQDNFSSYDRSGHVYMAGYMNWYQGGSWPKVVRSETVKNSYVQLQSPGCLWLKISYDTLTGTVSWPPSISANTVSDGWYRWCGKKYDWIRIDGLSYASRTLTGATVCLGYSFNATYELRRYTACHQMSAGGA